MASPSMWAEECQNTCVWERRHTQPTHRLGFCIVKLEELQFAVSFQWPVQIPHITIHLGHHSVLGQALRYALGDGKRGGAPRFSILHCTIWKGYLQKGKELVSVSLSLVSAKTMFSAYLYGLWHLGSQRLIRLLLEAVPQGKALLDVGWPWTEFLGTTATTTTLLLLLLLGSLLTSNTILLPVLVTLLVVVVVKLSNLVTVTDDQEVVVEEECMGHVCLSMWFIII
ncbi:hypothetical protein E2C01_033567 [Portunus trituberculatus]|uniref:Uncharacterized protein n=1 Tax=Portunus trituberculatus TaxID=210409 RepID=A0A5B7F0G5_PORTR|nr:hypothetical protein [Portunus trituberculatus]